MVIRRFRKGADLLVTVISSVMVLIGVSVTAMGAVVRTLGLPVSVVWVEEVTRYTIIWGAMLPMARCFRFGTQIKLSILEDKLAPRARRWLQTLILCAGLALFGYLTISGIRLAVSNRIQFSPALGLCMFWPYLALPVSCMLVVLELACMLVEVLRGGTAPYTEKGG